MLKRRITPTLVSCAPAPPSGHSARKSPSSKLRTSDPVTIAISRAESHLKDKHRLYSSSAGKIRHIARTSGFKLTERLRFRFKRFKVSTEAQKRFKSFYLVYYPLIDEAKPPLCPQFMDSLWYHRPIVKKESLAEQDKGFQDKYGVWYKQQVHVKGKGLLTCYLVGDIEP